jgi:hypothetical protein
VIKYYCLNHVSSADVAPLMASPSMVPSLAAVAASIGTASSMVVSDVGAVAGVKTCIDFVAPQT